LLRLSELCRPSAGALGDLSDAGEDSSIVQVLANYAKSTYAGRRRGELLGLQIEDVDPWTLGAGLIHVRHGWGRKEGHIATKER
jgi:hypothetical protein